MQNKMNIKKALTSAASKMASVAAVLMTSSMGLHAALSVHEVSPRCWWAGLSHSPLQVLLHGNGLSGCDAKTSAKDITISEIVRPANSHYLIIYLDVRNAQPQKFDITLTQGNNKVDVPYEIYARRTDKYAQGFDASDVLYLIMPDRFAKEGDESKQTGKMKENAIDRDNLSARHGGDLQGITRHLDYLADLVITTIWTTPGLVSDRK